MHKNIFYFVVILFVSCSNLKTDETVTPVLKGEYVGQATPGDSSVLFAPGFISTGAGERDIAISPDGKEFYFCREVGNFEHATIFVTKLLNGIWTEPEVLNFCKNPKYMYIEPHISADGKKLLFVSNMPIDSTNSGTEDIWVADREGSSWGTPYNIGTPVNTDSKEFFPSLTNEGTLYYTHLDTNLKDEFIYRSRLINGKYSEPQKVERLNIGRGRFNAVIARDESYIIIPAYGMPDSHGGADYYIIFRNKNDKWSQPVNMGKSINSDNPREWSPGISPDGNYIFFMSTKTPININANELSAKEMFKLHNSPQNGNSDIYWVSSDFINDLKERAVFSE